ncbi:MAG: EAL domain-containing protein [Sideroxydans sp.]|nr:EAL domain-containing protein [Sideroxydans sp.]
MVNTSEFFIGRQTILDRNQDLAGFELLFRSSQKNSAEFFDDVTATASVINHAFNELGFKTVLGKHRGFINVNTQMLMDDTIELLPREQVVIELLETIEFNDAVVERCKYLKSQGYMLALDDVNRYSDRLEPLRGCIDIIKIDLKLSGIGNLNETIAHLRSWPVKLLAEKVDTPEEAQQCMDAGFHLFQGYYFAKPIIVTGKRLSHSELVLMQLLGLIMSDADNEHIVQLFKQNAGLTFNLLRFANSAATGAHRRITSVGDAITVFGRRQLQRWLQLLVYTNDRKGAFPDPLLQLAATRGKCMELLAQSFDDSSAELKDHAFMVGIMSLMDTLLGMPLAEIISPINPPAEVRDALLAGTGLLGKLLLLIKHLEQYDMDAAGALLEELSPLSVELVNHAELEALAWSNSIAQAA